MPAQLVPDNPKVGVSGANWYEPGLNRTYLDLATHYGAAILPTRPRKPRDVYPAARQHSSCRGARSIFFRKKLLAEMRIAASLHASIAGISRAH